MSLQEQIRKLVAQNKLQACFEQLSNCAGIDPNELTSLEQQFSHKESEQRKGTITPAEYGLGLQKIGDALLAILSQIAPPPPPNNTPPLPPPNPKTWDYTQALRPTLTQTVMHELLMRRQSVNLTGDSGHGKSRLLRDIQHIAQQQGIPVALLNLKDHRLNYQQFLQTACAQLGITQNYTTFGDFAHHLGLHDRLFVLLIDNLEVLNEYASNDPLYDHHFVSSINLLKNMDNIHLLCASREWLKQVVFGGETSILTLHPIALSPLSTADIQAELQRQLPDEHPFLEKNNEKRQLRNAVQQHAKSCTLLDHLITRLKTHYHTEKWANLLQYCQNQCL